VDLLIKNDIDSVNTILQKIGFHKIERDGWLEFRREKNGRDHIYLFKRNSVYAEVHHDRKIHFLMFGVDYKPLKLLKELREAGIVFEQLGGSSWFTRRNRALLKGFKPWED